MGHKNVTKVPTENYKHFLESCQHAEYTYIANEYQWPDN